MQVMSHSATGSAGSLYVHNARQEGCYACRWSACGGTDGRSLRAILKQTGVEPEVFLQKK